MNVEDHVAWWKDYLKDLPGARIVDAGATVDDGEAWPYLVVQLPGFDETHKIEVSRDEEGNGPGFLFGVPEVKVVET